MANRPAFCELLPVYVDGCIGPEWKHRDPALPQSSNAHCKCCPRSAVFHRYNSGAAKADSLAHQSQFPQLLLPVVLDTGIVNVSATKTKTIIPKIIPFYLKLLFLMHNALCNCYLVQEFSLSSDGRDSTPNQAGPVRSGQPLLADSSPSRRRFF